MNKGFTLVEVIVALALLGIISAGLFATLANMDKVNDIARRKQKESEVLSNIATILRTTDYDCIDEDTFDYYDCDCSIIRDDTGGMTIRLSDIEVTDTSFDLDIAIRTDLDYNDYRDVVTLGLKDGDGCVIDSFGSSILYRQDDSGNFIYDDSYEYDDSQYIDYLALSQFKAYNNSYVEGRLVDASGVVHTIGSDGYRLASSMLSDKELLSCVSKSSDIRIAKTGHTYTIDYIVDYNFNEDRFRDKVVALGYLNDTVCLGSYPNVYRYHDSFRQTSLKYIAYFHRGSDCFEDFIKIINLGDLEFDFYFISGRDYNITNTLGSILKPSNLSVIYEQTYAEEKVNLYTNITDLSVLGMKNMYSPNKLGDTKVREYIADLSITDNRGHNLSTTIKVGENE